ncbi:hypothetical protein M408DRAFT_26018 [Serendipita vermifera MAFF 305830]|uniref:Uncharacterized protein n=1 Tax=Serendipita vermifera MAFF 305830 TaxID=933852 RepID=A0A0C2X908_SERVB|nr:hypothetical protein M408DRAFT_26018 [Serendipita vermifera MAFF 305830]
MIGQALSLVAATWLLVIRVIALYGGNKIVSIALYTVFITTHLVTIVVSGVLLHQVWEGLAYLDTIGICASSTSLRLLGVVYITPIVCESVLVGMQVVHAYRHTRQLGTFGRPLTPLLRTLYADGFAYYIIVVALRLWSALLFTLADNSWWYMSTYIEFSLISTSVSRLVLHLRGVASASSENPQDEDDGERGHSNSIPLSKMNWVPQ